MQVITREVLLKEAGLCLPEDLRLAVDATREALLATRKGQPDHAVRLQAADRIFDLADVRKPRAEQPDSSRPVNVTILIGDRAQGQVQGPSGYVLSLESTQQPALEAQGAVQAPDFTGNVQ